MKTYRRLFMDIEAYKSQLAATGQGEAREALEGAFTEKRADSVPVPAKMLVMRQYKYGLINARYEP